MSAKKLYEIVVDPQQRQEYQIIDVREPHELLYAKIPDQQIVNLSLSKSSEWCASYRQTKVIASSSASGRETFIQPSKPTLVLCHHGARSYRFAQTLGKANCF